LTESYECPADETDSWCELIYQSVQEGKCPNEIYLELLDGFEVDSVLGRSGMWQVLMGVALDSPLAAFHGYTRQEYASEKKINVASLFRKFDAADDSPEDSKEAQLIADTIFDLPYEEQCTLYYAATDRTQEKDTIKCAENIINALPAKNYDARCLLGMIYVNRQRYTEAEQLYKQLAAESDDESIAALYREMKKFRRQYGDRFMRDGIFVADEEELGGFLPDENAHVTVRRETPKIGRNDPCPCGSGKKYKKCCINKGL
jgi:tetratricopeptide (TPR) repeat protein